MASSRLREAHSHAGNDTGDSSGVNAELHELVTKGSLPDLRWPDFSDYKADPVNLYEPTRYTPLWLRGTDATHKLFKSAWKKGLEPEDYDASRWENRLSALNASDTALARFDVALTVCAMRFVSDRRIGRINAKHFKFGLSARADLPSAYQ
jgi:L,D-transpeptidase YcbB